MVSKMIKIKRLHYVRPLVHLPDIYTDSSLFSLFVEQLEKIEGGMDSINADMQIAEKALKGMELCCGVFPKFWKK